MKFQLEHVLPASADTSWQTIMSEDFANQSYAESGTQRELLSQEERNGKIYSVVKVKVNEELPPMAAKVLGTRQLSWTQQQIIDNSTRTMQWQIKIPGADKVEAAGSFKVIAFGEQSKRLVEGDVKVKIPLVGRKAEEHICRKLEDSYEKSARFTQQWLAKNH